MSDRLRRMDWQEGALCCMEAVAFCAFLAFLLYGFYRIGRMTGWGEAHALPDDARVVQIDDRPVAVWAQNGALRAIWLDVPSGGDRVEETDR